MKVAIIKSNYTPYGGGEKYTTRMIGAFAQRGIAVDVLTAEDVQWEKFGEHVRWVRIRQSRYNNLLRLVTFNASVNAYLKDHAYDCILGMDRTEYQTHLRAGGGCHASWLDRRCEEVSTLRCLTFRLNPFHRKMVRIERNAFRDPSLRRIFCNSRLVRDEIARYYPEATSKLSVVHNGVEWNEFEKAFAYGLRERDRVFQELNLDREMFHFLYVGSGYARKGLDKAILALGRLPAETALIVVGKDRHERHYRRLAEKLGIGGRTHFFGAQRNVIPFLQAADAFILPTIYDPFSNASLEALAMGLYTVTSRANGCAEVIEEGAGRVIEDLKDIESVADAMKTALVPRRSKSEIRDSVRHLDFDVQLNMIVDQCIADAG